VLRVHVTPRGTVDDVLVVRGNAAPDAERAAVEAARRLLFEPARRDGLPVDVWFTYPVRFDP
jgi:TonB family protein